MPSLPLHFLATPQMSNCKATLLISNTSHALTFALATLRHFSILHIHHPSTHMHAMHPISLQYFETWSLVDTTPSIHICKCKHIRLRNVKKTAAYWEVSFLGGGSGRSIELFEIVHWALLMLGQGQFREYITGRSCKTLVFWWWAKCRWDGVTRLVKDRLGVSSQGWNPVIINPL